MHSQRQRDGETARADGASRHMEMFPRDGIAATLQNVFDFDRYAHEEKTVIAALFERYVRGGDLPSVPSVTSTH